MGRAFFEHHPRAGRKRWRHPADTIWKAHPLMAVIRDAVREALEFRPIKHPDSKRTRRAKLESKARKHVTKESKSFLDALR